MISISPLASGYMMSGLLNLLNSTTQPAYVELYSTPRPANNATATGTLVATISLIKPAGTSSNITGLLTLTDSFEGVVLSALKPTWARFYTGLGVSFMDCDVRDIDDANLGEELVIQSSNLAINNNIKIVGGTFNAA